MTDTSTPWWLLLLVKLSDTSATSRSLFLLYNSSSTVSRITSRITVSYIHRQTDSECQCVGFNRPPPLYSWQQIIIMHYLHTLRMIQNWNKNQFTSANQILSFDFCSFQQVSDMLSHLLSCLHLDLSETKPVNCAKSLTSIISRNNSILFLPLVALTNIFASIMSWSKLPRLRTSPSHFLRYCYENLISLPFYAFVDFEIVLLFYPR